MSNPLTPPPGHLPPHILTAAELASLRLVGVTAFFPGMRLTRSGKPWLYVTEVIGDLDAGLIVSCEPGSPPPPRS